MRIGELARRTGVSERSLRYYEQQGLLASDRTPGGHREYPEGAVDRVIRIQEFYAAGLGSSKIYELLPCVRDSDGGPSAAATPRLVSDLDAERQRIDREIAELMRSREVLDEVIATAKEQPPPDGGEAGGGTEGGAGTEAGAGTGGGTGGGDGAGTGDGAEAGTGAGDGDGDGAAVA